jgi:hypothetical protein
MDELAAQGQRTSGKKAMEETGDDAKSWIQLHFNVACDHRAWLRVGNRGVELCELTGHSIACSKYHHYHTGGAGRHIHSA